MNLQAAEVLKFWFGEPGEPTYGQPRVAWFITDPQFDDEIRARFLSLHERAVAGLLGSWTGTAGECLALIIVLDQFSRNLFREDGRAYAADPLALAAARTALDRGFDRDLLPVQRQFIYLPFEHSEDPAIQDLSVELFRGLGNDDEFSRSALNYAERHRKVIKRFGRFPHRNADLGRVSTPEELEFLAGPDAPF